MKICNRLLSLLILAASYSCNQHKKETGIQGPVSDLCHIDLVIDSSTWLNAKNDSFIQKEFAVLNIDTTYYGGKPSYDLYLLGQLNFLHISQSKGFWAGQQGSGVLVFQTQKPGLKDSLLQCWKQFYKDSLFVHTYHGSDFTLDEIMPWYKRDSTKPKEPVMFPNLTSYSADAYTNWGITDSLINAGLSMNQFMKSWGGKELENKLFQSITELYMTINQQEFTEMKSALLAMGYAENGDNFTHAFNPAIFITVTKEKGKPKYSKVKFKLTRKVDAKEIVFSPSLTLKLNADEGWLLWK